MSLKRIDKLLAIFLIFTIEGCSFLAAPADSIKPAAIFGSNMVLQQNKRIPVWGKATPGGKVTIFFEGQKKSAVAAGDSLWRVDFAQTPAGGPYEMFFIGADTLVYKNVMVGEVWVCSGQSNMEMPVAHLGNVPDYEKEIASANYPNIRMFEVENNMCTYPIYNLKSEGWKTCTPATIPDFSATAYFFARYLHKNLKVPIGLVHSSLGGSMIEAWISGSSLKTIPFFTKKVEDMEKRARPEIQLLKEYDQNVADWWSMLDKHVDEWQTINGAPWESSYVDTSNWQKMKLPAKWESSDIGEFDGIVWFRKSVIVSSSWKGKDITLNLGLINDHDITWFNGVKVGSEKEFKIPRSYKIPGSLVKEGQNVITVRVTDTGWSGGIMGKPEQMNLVMDANNTISLAGEWLYRTCMDLSSLPTTPQVPGKKNRLMVLYNAMINPLIPYAIRGAIWYQGEANASRAYQYQTLFPTLVQDWRQNWAQGDFPFLFVQLANFMKINSQPEEAAWAELREAQLKTLSLPNTGMAVAIDIGDAKDIHPKNKQEVGRRLALNALGIAYDKDIVYSGPIYKSMIVEGNEIRLEFEHVGDGLVIKGGNELKGFAIAGTDKKFHWANAQIEGDNIVVSSAEVPEPIAVRYAWASNPLCNLYNKDGLPASPFRTDTWPGITRNIK